MKLGNLPFKPMLFACVGLLLLFTTTGVPVSSALGAFQGPPAPNSATVPTIAEPPPFAASPQGPASPAALSSTLSYYFISGNTFTPDIGMFGFSRQVIGCVNQMPTGIPFSAPVHLPQGSQVVSITLYTYDTIATATVSAAYFIFSDGKGEALAGLAAFSLPNLADTYQQNTSSDNGPWTIDNKNKNYYIQWRTDGVTPSPYLSLCGVRVAYYAPLGSATFLPLITR